MSRVRAARVAVLLSGSVFLDGVAARLRQEGMAVTVIPATTPDPVQSLEAVQPEAVVIESADPDRSALIGQILQALPTTVLCLDIRKDDLCIRTSRRVTGATTENLAAAIRGVIPRRRMRQGGDHRGQDGRQAKSSVSQPSGKE